MLGLGSFDGDLAPLPGAASFDGDTRGLESLGDYAFVLDRGGSTDSAAGNMDQADLLAMRTNLNWGPDDGQLRTIPSADGSLDTWQNASQDSAPGLNADDFERAISEGMDGINLSARGHGHHHGGQGLQGNVFTLPLGEIHEESAAGDSHGQYGKVYAGHKQLPDNYPGQGGMYEQPKLQQPNLQQPNHCSIPHPIDTSPAIFDPLMPRQGGDPQLKQHDGAGYPMGAGGMQHCAPPNGYLPQQQPPPMPYGMHGNDSPSLAPPAVDSPVPGSPDGRGTPRGRGAPLPGGALLPPMLKRRLSKVGAAGIGAMIPLPVGSPQDQQQMDEEELELFVLQNSGDESEEAKAARRKLQNRLAQRRRRKRNSMCASMPNIFDGYHHPVPQLDPSCKADDVDPSTVRRRRKSSDFASDEERLEWRRAQNREAKRRYRERRKSESVAGTGDPMATLAFLEELRMFQSQNSHMGGGQMMMQQQQPQRVVQHAVGPGPGPGMYAPVF